MNVSTSTTTEEREVPRRGRKEENTSPESPGESRDQHHRFATNAFKRAIAKDQTTEERAWESGLKRGEEIETGRVKIENEEMQGPRLHILFPCLNQWKHCLQTLGPGSGSTTLSLLSASVLLD